MRPRSGRVLREGAKAVLAIWTDGPERPVVVLKGAGTLVTAVGDANVNVVQKSWWTPEGDEGTLPKRRTESSEVGSG